MKIITAIALLLFTLPCYSEVTYEDFLILKSADASKMFITGAGAGFGLSNVYIKRELGKEMYCIPPTLALNYENYTHLMERYVEKNPESKNVLVEVILLMTLIDAFPCKD